MVTNVPSTTTLQYAVASNPGSCTSENLLWPDVRQFGSTVYQNDTTSPSSSPAAAIGMFALKTIISPSGARRKAEKGALAKSEQ